MNVSESGFFSRSIYANVSEETLTKLLVELNVDPKNYTFDNDVITNALGNNQNSILYFEMQSKFNTSWDTFLFHFPEDQFVESLVKFSDDENFFAIPDERSDSPFAYILIQNKRKYSLEILENENGDLEFYNLKPSINLQVHLTVKD